VKGVKYALAWMEEYDVAPFTDAFWKKISREMGYRKEEGN